MTQWKLDQEVPKRKLKLKKFLEVLPRTQNWLCVSLCWFLVKLRVSLTHLQFFSQLT